eukprot:12431006-Karenia_brevis.AAC.1
MQYLRKGGAVSASSHDTIGGCGDPRVKLVASDASACHMHLQTKFKHQWWVVQPVGLPCQGRDGYIVVKLSRSYNADKVLSPL